MIAMRGSRAWSIFRVLRALVFVALTFPALSASAQEGDSFSIAVNVLDGHRFLGEFIPSGKTSGRSDEFIFSDGLFHSRECLEWGFLPGPYWIRVESGEVHFFAQLTSEENGIMTYEGSVVESEIDARIEWIKPRWYWTMRRDFNFRGHSASNVAVDQK
jgi:hypothetical protein